MGSDTNPGKCPFSQKEGISSNAVKSQDWWPKSLNLDILSQHDLKTNHTNHSAQ